MTRKKFGELHDRLRGEHLSLCVAAHLARTQLVVDPLARYDGEHLMEMVEAIARALAKVAPLHVREGDAPRELSAGELEGAGVADGGNTLVLRGGRRHSSVTIRRADLRQAIAILKAVGIPELRAHAHAQASPPVPAAARRPLLDQLREVEQLLEPPLVQPQVARASVLLISIARGAPRGQTANLAMQLMSALHEESADSLPLLLPQLRAALEAAEAASS